MAKDSPSTRRREAARYSALRSERDYLLMVLRVIDSAKQLPPTGPTQTLLSETLARFDPLTKKE